MVKINHILFDNLSECGGRVEGKPKWGEQELPKVSS